MEKIKDKTPKTHQKTGESEPRDTNTNSGSEHKLALNPPKPPDTNHPICDYCHKIGHKSSECFR
jgi:hypothetical protein